MHLQAFLTYSQGSIALVPLLKTILTLSKVLGITNKSSVTGKSYCQLYFITNGNSFLGMVRDACPVYSTLVYGFKSCNQQYLVFIPFPIKFLKLVYTLFDLLRFG